MRLGIGVRFPVPGLVELVGRALARSRVGAFGGGKASLSGRATARYAWRSGLGSVPVITTNSITVGSNLGFDAFIRHIDATNSPTAYAIIAGNPSGYFALYNSGNLRTGLSASPPDGNYALTVTATNSFGTSPPATVTVAVGTAPVVNSSTFNLSLPTASGAAVGTATATGGTPTSWAIISGNSAGYFAIDNSGAISVTSAGASGITETTYNLTLRATNALGSDDGTITINAANAPPAGAWPDATNTGIQNGVTLTTFNGVLTITNSTPVQNLLINGFIKIATNNAVIRNCKIVMNGTSFAGVIDCYNGGNGGSGHLIEHCVIDGNNNNSVGNGVVGIGGIVNTEVRFCHIVRCVDGISTGHGTNNSNIHDNFIHAFDGTGVDPHNDGMVIEATNGCTVRHNTIYNQLNQSSCIDCSEFAGNTANITFDNNLFYAPNMIPKAFHIHQRNGNSINWASMVVTNNHWTNFEMDGSPGTMSGNLTDVASIIATLDLSMPP